MAQSEILGLFTTPEQYQQMRQMQQQQMAADYAGRSPQQQVRYGAYSAGQQFGGGLAGALGAQDPQLKIIAQRQALSKQIDPADPESIMKAANIAAQSGDQQFAMTLAEYARKAQSEMALIAQRGQEKLTSEDRNARAYALTKGFPGSEEYANAYQERLTALTVKGQEDKTPEWRQKQEELFLRKGQLRTLKKNAPDDPFIKDLEDEIRRLEGGAEKTPSFGTDRESIAAEMFNNRTFAQLEPKEKAAVNKRVEFEQGAKAKASAASITNVLPGQEKLVDITKFRRSAQETIDPQIKTVTAADQALQNINDSLSTNNFASFRAAQTQFARAITGSGDLSQKELKAAGADPSLLGGTADYISSLFTGTPTPDTQKKIRATLLAIKKVATKKANDELAQQRNMAVRSGYKTDDINAALNFPEFSVAAPSVGKEPVTRTLKSGKVVTVEE